MSITSVQLFGLELCSDPYFVEQEALTQLLSTPEVDVLLADMAGRHPHLVGWVEKERPMTLPIHLSSPDIADRKTAYDALVTAVAPRYGRLEYTDGSTLGWDVVCSSVVVDARYYRATVAVLAADPVAA